MVILKIRYFGNGYLEMVFSMQKKKKLKEKKKKEREMKTKEFFSLTFPLLDHFPLYQIGSESNFFL